MLKQRAVTLQDYQGILGQDIDEYETLDEVALDLTLKNKLWNGLRSGRTSQPIGSRRP